jgi:hypothetical protein
MSGTAFIALWGDFSEERLAVSELGEDFNWSARSVSGPEDLKRLSREGGIVAVLVHPSRLGVSWRDALRNVAEAAPRARVAICHGVKQAGSCDEMLDAGAFATLMLPLVRTEVRHFLGFVWASLPENRAGVCKDGRTRVALKPKLGLSKPAERGVVSLI